MVKFSTYVAVSALSVLVMVCYAVRTRQQFYPVMFYLLDSKISLALLVNMGLVMMCFSWQLITAIFLGTLRETEVERLNEHFWREVMEILFAMTVFRDELNLHFLFRISVLLFVKTHHWLVQKRVEYLETTTPSIERLSHVRLCTFMALLLTFDCLSFHRSFSHLLKTRQPSMSLFFAFEYAILTTTTITTCIKYALHMKDMFCERRSTGKDVYVFYVEFVQDVVQLSMYLLFFLLIFIHYGLPLHLVRELYETFQNFKTRIADFIRYRRLTSNMNERFQDPTQEEISRDPTCIICREEMTEAKKLPCGHLFHVHCLRAWLERQHTCPTCRAPLLGSEDGSEEQYDHDEEDVALELQDEEDNTFGDALENDPTAEEYATSHEHDEIVNPATRESDPNQTQLEATSTSLSTICHPTQLYQNFTYVAFTNGFKLWYPLFVPLYSGHQAAKVNLSAWDASASSPSPNSGVPNIMPGIEKNGRQNHFTFLNISNPHNVHTNKWQYMPRILQIHQTSNQPIRNTLPSKELVSSCTANTSSTNDSYEGRIEHDAPQSSTRECQSLSQIITWNHGTLDISRYEEQNAYLDHAIQILKGQLQAAIDLQRELQLMHARDIREDLSPEGLPNSQTITIKQNLAEDLAQEVTGSTCAGQRSEISLGKSAIQQVKDHCQHCPTQSTSNLPSS